MQPNQVNAQRSKLYRILSNKNSHYKYTIYINIKYTIPWYELNESVTKGVQIENKNK